MEIVRKEYSFKSATGLSDVYARSWAQENDTDTPRITAMTVVITVAKRDSSGNDVPLCTQKAIVPLPGEPVILYAPG